MAKTDTSRPLKILAISSGGGHWEQLMLLRDSFSGCQVVYANTIPGLAEKSGVSPVYIVTDCNRDKVGANIRCVRDIFRILRKERPDVVISTGAAPGLIGLAIGRVFGAKAIWVDSVANSEKLSLSGKMAGRIANLWVTQWSHLAGEKGPRYFGSVL